jgi:hypothetical protein
MGPKYTSKRVPRGILFENRKKNRPQWYLEHCRSRRGILFVSENVKVHRVYFYTEGVPRVYHTYWTYRAHRTPHTHNITHIL